MSYQAEHPEGCWGSPEWLVEHAREILGTIDLDPCSTETDNLVVRADKIFTEHDDGLKQDWRPYRNIFVNAPGGAKLVKGFWNKACAHYHGGHGNVFWVGFNLGQLRYLMPSPIAYNFAIPRSRIKFRDPTPAGRESGRYDNYVALLSRDKGMKDWFNVYWYEQSSVMEWRTA